MIEIREQRKTILFWLRQKYQHNSSIKYYHFLQNFQWQEQQTFERTYSHILTIPRADWVTFYHLGLCQKILREKIKSMCIGRPVDFHGSASKSECYSQKLDKNLIPLEVKSTIESKSFFKTLSSDFFSLKEGRFIPADSKSSRQVCEQTISLKSSKGDIKGNIITMRFQRYTTIMQLKGSRLASSTKSKWRACLFQRNPRLANYSKWKASEKHGGSYNTEKQSLNFNWSSAVRPTFFFQIEWK